MTRDVLEHLRMLPLQEHVVGEFANESPIVFLILLLDHLLHELFENFITEVLDAGSTSRDDLFFQELFPSVA